MADVARIGPEQRVVRTGSVMVHPGYRLDREGIVLVARRQRRGDVHVVSGGGGSEEENRVAVAVHRSPLNPDLLRRNRPAVHVFPQRVVPPVKRGRGRDLHGSHSAVRVHMLQQHFAGGGVAVAPLLGAHVPTVGCAVGPLQGRAQVGQRSGRLAGGVDAVQHSGSAAPRGVRPPPFVGVVGVAVAVVVPAFHLVGDGELPGSRPVGFGANVGTRQERRDQIRRRLARRFADGEHMAVLEFRDPDGRASLAVRTQRGEVDKHEREQQDGHGEFHGRDGKFGGVE